MASPGDTNWPYRVDLAENVEDALEKMEGGNQVNGRLTRGLIKPGSKKFLA